jgi:hypothetical protein
MGTLYMNQHILVYTINNDWAKFKVNGVWYYISSSFVFDNETIRFEGLFLKASRPLDYDAENSIIKSYRVNSNQKGTKSSGSID